MNGEANSFDFAAERVLAHIFERLPAGTAVIDRDFRLRRFNPTWADFIERYTPSAAADVRPGVSLFDLEPGTEAVLRPLFALVFAGETVRREGLRLESEGYVSYQSDGGRWPRACAESCASSTPTNRYPKSLIISSPRPAS